MGRIRRGGYIFTWWIGDHEPPHVHLYDDNGKFITQINLRTMQPMDTASLPKTVPALISQLQKEGRL